jgi:WD40 repeat protein
VTVEAVAPTVPQSTPIPESPYKGLRPFTPDDAAFFFGRDSERRIIRANLMSARLTLLYGASGVGKSSVLLAGVVPDLLERAHKNAAEGNPPGLLPVVFSQWKDDPVGELTRTIRKAAAKVLGEKVETSTPLVTLDAELERIAERIDGPVLIVLDQFEEYFLYHGDEDGEDTFAVQFPRVVNRHDLRVGFLVAIREDAIAKLDRFKGRIPQLFDNYLRIEHLDPTSARDAITRPLEEWNRRVPESEQMSIEKALVDAVLEEVRPEQIAWEQTGGDQARDRPTSDRIDTSFLQLVVERLWRAETGAGSRTMRESTLRELGGAKGIVREHVEEGMPGADQAAERAIATAIFQFLVTSSGSKVAHTAADLAGFAEESPAAVETVLEALASGDVRILKTVAPPPGHSDKSYELYHDLLAEPVLAWRARQVEQAHELRARRKARRYAASALVMLGVAGFCAWLAIDSRRSKIAATASEQVALATAKLASDPAASVGLAAKAFNSKPTEDNRYLLLDSLAQPLENTVVSTGHELTDAAPMRVIKDGRSYQRIVVGGRDGQVRVLDAITGKTLRTVTAGSPVVAVAAGGSRGTFLARTSKRELVVWDGAERWSNPGIDTAVFDPSGRLVLAGHDPGYVDALDATSGRRLEEVSPDALLGVPQIAVSSRGTRVVVAGDVGGTFVYALDASRRTPLRLLHSYTFCDNFAFGTVAVSADGRTAAVGTTDGCVRAFDTTTGNVLRPFNYHFETKVAFDPTGKYLGIGVGKRVTLWRTESGREGITLTLQGHKDWVRDFDFRANGSLVATASDDGTARVWETATGLPLYQLLGHTGPVDSIAFQDTRVITTSNDGSARLWSLPRAREFRGHKDWVRDASFVPSERIVTTSYDWATLAWKTGGGSGTSFGVQGDWAEVATGGRFVVLFVTDGIVLEPTDAPGDSRELEGPFTNGSASSDGRVLAVVEDKDVEHKQGRLKLFEYTNGTYQRIDGFKPITVDLRTLQGLAMSPNGALFAAYFQSGLVELLSTTDGHAIAVLKPHTDRVNRVVFSRDGTLVVTTSRDGTARVLQTSDGHEVVAPIRPPAGGVDAAAFSEDNGWLALAGAGGITTVWDWRAHRILGVMRMHADYVNSVQFGPNDSLLTASDDHTAKLYRCETCRLTKRQLFDYATNHEAQVVDATEKRTRK